VTGATIHRLIGVYHADGGFRGEVAYAIGRIRGTVHCALCDVTHRGLRPKREWTRLAAGVGVPFDLVHLNERSAPVRAASAGHTPCVLADTDRGLIRLLDPGDLDRLAGDVTAFAAALQKAAHDAGLRWPTVTPTT
jgi:hypothetical protein